MALIDLDEATRLDPANPWPYINRGNVYREQDQYESAITEYNTAIELDPGIGLAYYVRGLAYRYIGDIESARADFEKALELGYDPERVKQLLAEIGFPVD